MSSNQTNTAPFHRRFIGFGLLTLSFCMVCLLAPTSPARADAASCPNQARRLEQGEAALALPECRAYEQVSPLGMEPFFATLGEERANVVSGSLQRGISKSSLAAGEGNAFTYVSTTAPVGSESDGPFYLSRRGSSGWSTENVIPPQSTEYGQTCLPLISDWSADLAMSVLDEGFSMKGAPPCGADMPPLIPGEPRGAQNLFLRDSSSGSYRLVNITPENEDPANAEFVAASSDLSHVVFRESARLTPAAPPIAPGVLREEADYYEYLNGALRLITVLPDGVASPGSVVEGARGGIGRAFLMLTQPKHAVSRDGERVIWETQTEPDRIHLFPNGLYLRENAGQPPTASGECTPLEPELACTVRIDALQGGTGEGEAMPVFRFASADGTRVFFTDEQRLTADSNAVAGAPDLYEFDLERPVGDQLTDLTPDASEPANVLGVAGISEDGSRIYFTATAALTSVSAENSQGEHAQAGQPNLYLLHAGITTYLATLAPGPSGDQCDWGEFDPRFRMASAQRDANCLTARVSPDGGNLVFNSIRPLTGFDSTPVDPSDCGVYEAPEEGAESQFVPQPCQEIFRYDASDDALECASCGSLGLPPGGPANITYPEGFVGLNQNVGPYRLSRNVDDAGAVVFDTKSSLLPADENGVSDVYEYADGGLSLISSGKDPSPSYFVEASESGKDVFFLTAQSLLTADTDGETSVYDARVDGGFPEPPPAPECEGETCRGPATAPSTAATPGTPAFSGPEEGSGHPRKPSCRKGFVKKRGKCVKKHRKHHSHRKHGRAGR